MARNEWKRDIPSNALDRLSGELKHDRELELLTKGISFKLVEQVENFKDEYFQRII